MSTNFFQAVDAFLADQGFYPHLARDNVTDGHSLRKSLAEIKASGCVSDGHCSVSYIQPVLDAMKDVPQWNEQIARQTLRNANIDDQTFNF